MATLTRTQKLLDANISDLTGLGVCNQLGTNLNLGTEHVEGRPINSNSVSDISPLTSLTNLTFTGSLEATPYRTSHLWQNLTNLTELNSLGQLEYQTSQPVAGLINLIFLDLDGNRLLRHLSSGRLN